MMICIKQLMGLHVKVKENHLFRKKEFFIFFSMGILFHLIKMNLIYFVLLIIEKFLNSMSCYQF
jgi:hypothetical protein